MERDQVSIQPGQSPMALLSHAIDSDRLPHSLLLAGPEGSGKRACAQWLAENIPTENPPVLLHNDYKFDNLVLDPGNFTSIIAVLDWEMATVGDPLMDLGTSLAYWAEPDDESALKAGSLTRLPGTLNREDAVQRYSQQSARDVSKIVFYYVYGCFKLGVIVQQIYSRFKKGVTQDPRFASLLARVVACGENLPPGDLEVPDDKRKQRVLGQWRRL